MAKLVRDKPAARNNVVSCSAPARTPKAARFDCLAVLWLCCLAPRAEQACEGGAERPAWPSGPTALPPFKPALCPPQIDTQVIADRCEPLIQRLAEREAALALQNALLKVRSVLEVLNVPL